MGSKFILSMLIVSLIMATVVIIFALNEAKAGFPARLVYQVSLFG